MTTTVRHGTTLGLLTLFAVAQAADPLLPDKNLDAAIKAALPHHKGELTEKALSGLYVLDASGKGIQSLAGLEKCPNLAEARFAKNQIADLKPLAGLKNLQSLTLSANKVADLAPLKELVALQYLELSDNQIADIGPLTKLKALASLYIGNNRVSDLKPVSELSKLSTLSLPHNKVKDIAPVAKLVRLKVLDLTDNEVESLAPLAKLSDLSLLMLAKNKLTDLGPFPDACQADANGPKRFAPYLRLYLADNPLSESAKSEQLAALKKAGVRVEDMKRP